MIQIPNTVFGLLAIIITTLCGVILYQQRKVDVLYKEKSDLQDRRLADANIVREHYDTVMGEFSKSFNLFVAKLDGKEER